jgi:hypothetical protein
MFHVLLIRERSEWAQTTGQAQIKGAARVTVRPKSREETPKEGNETSDKSPASIDI